ncbi:hypothetical protein [Kordiimonas gwangyangensis]|uniref:hypothetical protein n=1 Tax=Kordiimonas gwangyangensis TaxID=288022 RepID=UPI00037D32EF|nr:hypothetical protein [Kordiimonas gwangyangensis]
MTIRAWLSVTAAAVLSVAALAAGGLTIVNDDDTAYTLILEDADEKTWEVSIEPHATLSDICSDCYVAIKGQENFIYADEATQLRISGGQLVQ